MGGCIKHCLYDVVFGCVYMCRYTAGMMDEALCQGQDLQSNRPLQALVAGLKAYSTWANVACLQECRECTGGMVSASVLMYIQYSLKLLVLPYSAVLVKAKVLLSFSTTATVQQFGVCQRDL